MPAKDRDTRSNARRRTLFSFVLACCLYLPLLGFALWQFPSLAFTAAGQHSTVSLSFAQISGASAGDSAQETIVPDKTAPEPEPVVESKPEPVTEVAKPEPRPSPMPEVKPVKKTEKKQKTVSSPEKKRHQPKKSAPVPAANPSPSPSVQQGAPTSGNEAGIYTLVHGETDDPFLSEVKRCVEKNVTYSRRARMLRLQGKTVVEFIVELDGSLRNLRLISSSGHEQLDQAVLKAIEHAQKEWEQPDRIVRLRFPIVFQLRG